MLSQKSGLRLQHTFGSGSVYACRRLASTTAIPWPTFAKQLLYHRNGATTNVLQLEKNKLPEIQASDVGVAMLRSPVNPADVNAVEGVYPIRPPMPAVGGGEGVGVVVKVGEGVTDLKAGDWVIPRAAGALGTWQSHLVHAADNFVKVPNDIPAEYASILSVNPPTAFRMLEDFADLKEGDVVAQNGATSAVGRAVIQMCALKGVKTINLIRDRPNIEEVTADLKALGATYVVTDSSARLPETRAMLKKEKSAKLGLNCVGGKSCAQIVRYMGNNGVLVTYGGMAKEPVTLPTASQIFQNIKAIGFWMSQWYTERGKADRLRMVEDIAGM
ncbi:hypothetical protein SARC_07148 [Sphaeroforma arctica JP610]|uniref:enoyl-[acyl-carrier-protein] reductase n=1 Tax=Sphaeroforma arctica JP610 TaxID=667725 RepID=A0A0L0FVA0_9EUKA|nr:hypothetical protein SARC_07148 [Sphaeroforma arctica JP610]KNC80486.1 hypothetical protein SARC_07148 [Sphaeroforma arctica JP610]|eukprot:XP_014154388.1 hypothetical protein SARC_07148 [Sphaeroforma arctica JP610]